MPLIVVTGPPCAGKSTYVTEHRSPGDLVVDVDMIAHALGYPAERIDWAGPDHPARHAARATRQLVTDSHVGPRHTTWLIDTKPHPTSLRIWQRQGVQVVTLDPGAAECRQRAVQDGRPAATLTQIDRWYDPVVK